MALIDLKNITAKEIAKGYFAKLIHTDKMSFSFVEVKAGESLPEHAHPHEQVSIIQQGTFQLTLDGKPVIFNEGQLVIIPSNTKHSGLAITDCKLLDVFYPVRDDYKALSDH
ncbi:cupin domain protein [mine drainage metagenome]|uniref:Cupin domain protein n=1 Tax=mine drainage metagenome TaxID=410659 RepID=A0A1J5SZ30_9ZZZZ